MVKDKKIVLNKKFLKPLRQELRNNSTSAEAELWGLLKNKQVEGRKFRRQYGIENFIVDFYCPSEKLIIELDGDPHGDYAQINTDEIRDKFLEENGFKVLRFENRFVFQAPEYVIELIKSNFKG